MGQWEYQIFAKGALEAGDQIWVADTYLSVLPVQNVHQLAS